MLYIEITVITDFVSGYLKLNSPTNNSKQSECR